MKKFIFNNPQHLIIAYIKDLFIILMAQLIIILIDIKDLITIMQKEYNKLTGGEI